MSKKSQKSHLSIVNAAHIKQKFTEKDLLRLVVESPEYLGKALGQAKGADTGLETQDQKREMLKYLYRSWSGITKYLLKQASQKQIGRAHV